MVIRNSSARIARFALCALIAAVTLSACTRHVSRGIGPDARADEVVFPSVDRIVLKEGTFPNVDNLGQIGSGVTKDQLYHLIGRPHFREGYAAREWDYLFHFRQGEAVVTCQYKVIFDQDYHGRSFHWSPAGCADRLKTQAPAVVATAAAAAGPKRFELSADALFAFARSEPQDILPQGREQLAAVAGQLKGAQATVVQVIGHTDRIGDEAANLALSQRRAQTVRALLIHNGMAADGLKAQGVGESEPVKECSDSLPRNELVDCLQPNRRVEVVVWGLQ